MDFDLDTIENIVDANFIETSLTKAYYSQAMWEILSFIEQEFSRLGYLELNQKEISSAVDNYINIISHPLRVCHERCERKRYQLKRELSQANYNIVSEWFDRAHDYNLFCSIFPLARNNKIELNLLENEIITNKSWSSGLPYEAYNRFQTKTGIEQSKDLNHNKILKLIHGRAIYIHGKFEIVWDKTLALDVIHAYTELQFNRYHLPDDWKFSKFSFGQYKKVIHSISALSFARYLASLIAFNPNELKGYPLRVWVKNKKELISQLELYINIEREIISDVIDYLTFGSKGIRTPDIATQPLVELDSDTLAISASLLSNIDIERNICTLINQIKEDRYIYSSLVDEKETILSRNIKEKVESLGFRCAFGKLKKTDLDFAIIDDTNKLIVGIELKWFIEPAEVREIIARSKELIKGTAQAKNIGNLFNKANKKLLSDILKVDSSYTYYPIVGSFNWIGFDDIQDNEIPIIKIWHLLDYLEKSKSLPSTVDFLRKREYLFDLSEDYNIVDIHVKSGELHCKWYGFHGLTDNPA